MNYIEDIEIAWNEFEQTGSVNSYLKYKGILSNAEHKNENSSKEDGEPIGCH